LPRAAHAAGEQTGRISGTIIEQASGAPIPGANVRVSGAALIGGPRQLVTSDDGHYEAIGLPQGRYDVEVSYSGVKPVKRRVFVRQGETTPLDINWSPELAQAEVTVVVEERHMTKPDSTQSGTVISQESESKVAMSDRRYQFFANQVAGITSVDNGLFQNVKGGNYLANRYLVDGIDITDPVTDTFSANINLDLVQSEEVLTGGMEAEYNALGGVFNVITNAGSDEWHLDSSIYVNNASFSASNKYGAQIYNGYRQFLSEAAPATQSYQANVNLGGPILKHRLWFNISAEYLYEQFGTPAGPPINVQHPAFYRHQFLGHLKLTWAPDDKHRLSIAMHTDPAFLNNFSGRFSGLANYELGVAEERQNQGGMFMAITWDYFKSQNLNAQINFGYQWQLLDHGPQGILGSVDFGPTNQYGMYGYSNLNKVYDPNRPQQVNVLDNTVWYQGGALSKDRRQTVTLDPSVSIRGNAAGQHDAKVGLQMRFVYHTLSNHVPGGSTYTDLSSSGALLEAGLCNQMTGDGCFMRTDTPDYSNHQWGMQVGGFIQDRWKPFKRLTVLPGLRVDWGITKNSIGQTVSNLVGAGPRLGFTVDITGDQKTIFSAFYGRSNEVMTLMVNNFGDVSGLTTVNLWNQQALKFQPAYHTGGANGYQIDPNMKAPHTDEVSLSLRREIFTNSIASIEYTYKKTSNIFDAIEVNQIWDLSGTRVIGYVNGQPIQIYKVSTPDQNYRIYNGIDFIVESKPTQNWDFYAAYTLSWLYGHGAEQLGQVGGYIGSSAFYNPRETMFFDGYLPEDTRHNLKVRASYTFHGLVIGGLFNYVSGTPISKQFFNTNDGGYTNLRAPQGNDPGKGAGLSTPNDPGRWSEFRLPDTISLDLRMGYDFNALIHQHIILMADFFNLFNLSTPTSLDNTNSSTFATVTARQRPFRFELGLRYVY
jgi:hypothetical protein